MKYSNNKKLQAVLSAIEEQLLSIHDTRGESIAEIERYVESFPTETDYNIAQYGNALIYYSDVLKMYRDAGYKSTDKMSMDRLWETYKRQVGYVARLIINGLV